MPTKSVPTPYPTFLTKDLLLDPENPRIVEFGLGEKPTQFDIMKTLWERMAVNEVATSIAWNGYFLHEPLFIEQDGKGQLIVIEGNRRLTAVKLLLDADLRKRVGATDLPDIDKIDKNRREELTELPGKLTTRVELWRYLGFKHVNGPATWVPMRRHNMSQRYTTNMVYRYHRLLNRSATTITQWSASITG